jgi:outer membrane protein OmpA-like peptidoglycan-associated protein
VASLAAEKEEHALMQRRSVKNTSALAAPPAVQAVLRSPGKPLDAPTRAFMESRFNHDFSQVRIHTDDGAARSADMVEALAYTVGPHIAFARNQYAPGTPEGRRTLAHELTHVIQQSRQAGPAPAALRIGPAACGAERQADDTGRRIANGASRVAAGYAPVAPVVQRLCGPAAIGVHAECTDQGPNFLAGEPLFRFIVNCDDFAAGEEANLRTTAAALPANGTIEIHGYASVDGDAAFNKSLSCARAIKARDVLTSAGIAAGRISIIDHGATPGPAADRRSVVIHATAAPAPPVPPAAAPSIAHQTVEVTPGSRNRTDIGVGEDVTLTFSGGNATWVATAGTLSANFGNPVTFTAPDTELFVGVGAAQGAARAVVVFHIIAPMSVTMSRRPGTGVKHHHDLPDSGINALVHLGPDNINFHHVIYHEINVAGVASPFGAYACNPFSGGHCGAAVGAACNDLAMTANVIAGMGTQAVLGDCAYSGHCGGSPPFAPGFVMLSIPYEYKVGTGAFHRFTSVPQVHILAADHVTLSTDKAGAHGATTVGAPTTVIARCP